MWSCLLGRRTGTTTAWPVRVKADSETRQCRWCNGRRQSRLRRTLGIDLTEQKVERDIALEELDVVFREINALAPDRFEELATDVLNAHRRVKP